MGFELYRVVEKSPCGRFIRYDQLLGGGAYKEVYIGYDRVEEIEVAWNQIVYYGDDETLKNPEKLFSEAIMLKSLNHERVMKCFKYWFDSKSKTLNIITELFPSGSLKKYLSMYDNGVGVDLASIKNWGKQILEGLSFLHSQSPKIIHRDIKCDNVFVDSDGKQVKLGDFGLAVSLTEGDFMKEKEAKGSPEFMAPECYDGEYNELVDIYSFGMCLLEMVTGEYPYMECSTPIHIFKKVYTGIKPASLGKVKDSRVKDIIEKCMLPMSDRPSAEELLKDPFFLYNGGLSTLEACAPAASFLSSPPFRGLHCCARDIRNLYLV
ncbi:serine/threonine-protein kinase WNK8-like [Lycium ferocissimum]|uniref:serine/threonine-protein kinase WNK8-like n=1 Tax=Lycium ferocissimum TaxID=112874 RepID=UPI0028149F26|nr:serine/threonine-protein kinase WNK8-like [Lycium ferocissimum]